MKYDFSLVLPVQNQARITETVIGTIVRVLKKHKIDYQLVMVENGSTDDTLAVLKKIARKNKRVVVTVSPSGYGRAVVRGLNVAQGKYLAYMPSDGQCDPLVLVRVIKTINQPEIDLVKVFRTSRESVLRMLISRGFNLLANLIFGLNSRDINASPTGFAQEKLKLLDLKSPDSFLDTELLIKARRFGWNIVRLPMRNFKRSGGKSTVRPAIVIEFIRNMLCWKFNEKL